MHVLTPTYVPTTAEEINLFTAHNKFMYSVFEQCLLTTKSKHLVQLQEKTSDAQKVYADLLATYKKDLTASLNAADLQNEIILMHLDE